MELTKILIEKGVIKEEAPPKVEKVKQEEVKTSEKPDKAPEKTVNVADESKSF